MDEAWARLAVVVGVLVIPAAFALRQRRSRRGPIRDITSTGLEPGVYLFSSSACIGCEAARAKLDDALGEGGYTEVPWEVSPQVFADLDVTAVPAVLRVVPGGEGRLYPGQPRAVLGDV
jgi:hypothetical protein